uniref:Uncharacterized protein n=1 Tax=Arundo donax TaxID=35708 RepID=A0A0A8Y8A5_ARUDO
MTKTINKTIVARGSLNSLIQDYLGGC